LAWRCTPSALCLGLGVLVLACLVLLSLLAFLLVFKLLFLEILLRPRGKYYVGLASVSFNAPFA
jgi:hypothetical protein